MADSPIDWGQLAILIAEVLAQILPKVLPSANPTQHRQIALAATGAAIAATLQVGAVPATLQIAANLPIVQSGRQGNGG